MAKQKKAAGEPKLNVRQTILTGFGFLATSIAWAIYDPYITKILNKLLSSSPTITAWSNFLVEKVSFLTRLAEAQGENVHLVGGGFTLVPLFIGFIMTFDNIFGVIFQPTFGKLSDNCHSKLGKRRPFIVACAPISALLFMLIPIIFRTTGSLAGTMICIILFVFVMSIWRAPVVALMPDLTPPALQSEGNAIINLMGGLGTGIGMVAGTIGIALCGLFTGMTKEQIKADETVSFPYVFAIGSVVMILGMLILLFFVHEKDTSVKLKGEENAYVDAKARRKAEQEEKRRQKAELKKQKLSKGERKSLIFMLMCLFFLFCGSNAVTTFFSLFAQEILHKITSEATILMLVFAAVSAAAAIPAGKMGRKWGRKKTIVAGLALFMAAFIVFFGFFISLLGRDGLSINKYVTVNGVYTTVNDSMNDFNSDLSEAAKTAGTEVKMLTMDGYIAYLNAPGQTSAETEGYAAFDKQLHDSVDGIEQAVISTAGSQLGTTNATYATALQALADAVKSVTGILGWLIYPVMIIAGAANMFITVNTLPLVLEIGGVDKVGTFTGYYYTATFSAQIASPILYGFIRMFAGTYMSLFYYCPIMFFASLLMILFVKHGEAIPDELIEEAEAAGD